jgi:RecA-family ATPase
MIYCHHHSKGMQGGKKSMDRASGSGVFARDPDAQLDMIELELSDEVRNMIAETGATGWRLEGSLREFENFRPVDFWFEYPIHRVDNGVALSGMPTQGSADAGKMKNRYHKSAEDAAEEFRIAFQMENMDGEGVSVKDMAAHMGLAERTVRNRIERMNGEFILDNGMIRLA